MGAGVRGTGLRPLSDRLGAAWKRAGTGPDAALRGHLERRARRGARSLPDLLRGRRKPAPGGSRSRARKARGAAVGDAGIAAAIGERGHGADALLRFELPGYNSCLSAGLTRQLARHDLAGQLGSRGAAELKRRASEAVNERLRPIRARRSELIRDRGHLRTVLRDRSAKARGIPR